MSDESKFYTFETCPGFDSWWEGQPLPHWYCKHCGGVLAKHKPKPINEGQSNAEG